MTNANLLAVEKLALYKIQVLQSCKPNTLVTGPELRIQISKLCDTSNHLFATTTFWKCTSSTFWMHMTLYNRSEFQENAADILVPSRMLQNV